MHRTVSASPSSPRVISLVLGHACWVGRPTRQLLAYSESRNRSSSVIVAPLTIRPCLRSGWLGLGTGAEPLDDLQALFKIMSF